MGGQYKNKDDKHLPQYVHRGKSSYEYRPYGKGVKRPCFKLCPLSSPVSDVWKKYEEIEGRSVHNLAWLLNEYKNSPQFTQIGNKAKSKDTIEGQKRQIEFITKYPLRSGRPFGSSSLENITKGVIRKYLDKRAEKGSPVSGNREKSLISAAWNWALERDLIKWDNPCLRVKRNPESARDRYVDDKEYKMAYGLALKSSSKYLPIMMELAFLCRMRCGEIRKATVDQVKPEGFDTKRLKGSKDTITLWSKRLRKAIAEAKNLPSLVVPIDTQYLIHDKFGQAISKTAFDSAWRRLMEKLVKLGIEHFTFHDLKPKGVSDFTGNKQDASGHKTAAQVAVYDRKKKRVKPTK